jgi:UDP-hydrolysing UDP-N-acetyl-D-glucosamine 2-epimerase
MMKRKVGVVTGSRAEYGLLYWLLKEIQSDLALELQLFVTGMHLLSEFGETYKAIEKDGFTLTKVEMPLKSDSIKDVTKSLGAGVVGFADVFEKQRPDVLVLLGDRYEILAAAQAAMIARIPMAHIHGGETTEGAFDEAIRHALTKMSHFHYVASDVYRKRVIQLGESPERVLNFGAVGLDNIRRLKLLSKEELEEAIEFKFGKVNFLVSLHPTTLTGSSNINQGVEKSVTALFEALDHFSDAKIIFTKSNSDPGGQHINSMLEKYVSENKDRAILFSSLGQLRYLSALKHVDVVIGNSSSGLIEVPAVGKPTVDIGDRQRGRLRAPSVINCEGNSKSIRLAIEKALSDGHKKISQKCVTPYGGGNTAAQIKEHLKSAKLEGVLMKKFYDVEFTL